MGPVLVRDFDSIARSGVPRDDARGYAMARVTHPLQRVGEVDETSDAILYLARARFVTGAVLDVVGGYAHGR